MHFLNITQQSNIFLKLKLLASYIHNISKKLYILAFNIVINKMIVRFFRWFTYIFQIKNKLILKEYKILSLCELSYIILLCLY